MWPLLLLIALLSACDDDDGPTGPGTSGPIAAVTAGYTHLCAVGNDGESYCWGTNGRGELGSGEMGESSWEEAVRVIGDHGFTSLAAGQSYTSGLAPDGAAWCWGTNSQSVLGSETTSPSPTPKEVSGGHSFRQVAAGEDFACGLSATGEAYCWGWNAAGQLGSGDTIEVHSTPVAVAGGIEFSYLTGGYSHACGVAAGGDAFCWGSDSHGKLGRGADRGDSRTPVAVVGGVKFAGVTAGLFHTCGLTLEGVAYCWGSNGFDQLGSPSFKDVVSSEPVLVAGGHRWAQLDAGPHHSCGVTTANAAYCWGAEWEIFGVEAGRFTTEPFPIPGGHAFTSVSAGAQMSCGVTTEGKLFCWGLQHGDEPVELTIPTPDH